MEIYGIYGLKTFGKTSQDTFMDTTVKCEFESSEDCSEHTVWKE